MNKLLEKLDQIKWLQNAGIEYYCSKQKDSKNSLIKKLKQISRDNFQNKVTDTNITKPKSEIRQQSTKIKDNEKPAINIARARKLAEAASSLQELKTIVENFDGCALRNFATNTVFCDGKPDAKIRNSNGSLGGLKRSR